MTEFMQVVTTTDTRESAAHIAKELLERRLAGCVQVGGPITSSYRWQGRIETAEEWVCAIKTAAAKYEAVERQIRASHPYDTPEILAFPVAPPGRVYSRA